METIHKDDLDRKIKLNEVEAFTYEQVKLFAEENMNEITKSLDNDIEKGKKSPIGTIHTSPSGVIWRKVSETGNSHKDWVEVKANKTKDKDELDAVSDRDKYASEGEKLNTEHEAKRRVVLDKIKAEPEESKKVLLRKELDALSEEHSANVKNFNAKHGYNNKAMNKDKIMKAVADEIKSFSPIKVISANAGGHLQEDFMFVRAAQILWDEPKEGEIQKSRGGTYMNTPENMKLGRVGQKFGTKKEDKKDERRVPSGDDDDLYAVENKKETNPTNKLDDVEAGDFIVDKDGKEYEVRSVDEDGANFRANRGAPVIFKSWEDLEKEGFDKGISDE